MSAVGANVLALRRARGLDQQQLAEQAHISKSYLCHVEKGRREPTKKVLGDLAAALEVEPDHLAGDPLSSTSTAWWIEYERVTGGWERYEYAASEAGAKEALAVWRTSPAPGERWRAVRVETTETLEAW